MLEVRLLGQFDVRKKGNPALIPSRPAQSLLAYLILTAGITHRREKLAGLLWPDSSRDNARNNLRQALWRVRKALGDGGSPKSTYLFTNHFSVEFNPKSDYWLDVSTLESQVRKVSSIDQLMELLKIYRGELLPGYYDDWVLLERQRLQALFEREVDRLLDQLIEEQRWRDVLEWGEQWIAYGQNPEPAYRALMNAHGALGNRSQVAQTFDRCVQALRDDLGVEPSEQTVKLFEKLSQGPYVIETASTSGLETMPSAELPSGASPPYKGLLHFDEADAGLFFGRELLTARIVERLQQERLLILLGASGSGKSSLVRAGLVHKLMRQRYVSDGSSPAARDNEQYVQVITPTERPLESLAHTLARLSDYKIEPGKLQGDLEQDTFSFHRTICQLLPDGRQFVLIVDQLEELFTLSHDPFEREAFVDHVLSTVSEESSCDILVVLALRADFYAHCARYDGLRQALVEHQEYIGQMSAEELRQAIEGPASLEGWQLEPGLSDLILAEIGDEPGKLPLLSHALLETWNRRSGRALTLKGYTESGGVQGAISHTAEMVYQKLSADQQEIARHIFLQLTELGFEAPDTRRRANRLDLISHGDRATKTQEVLNALIDARLVTTGVDSVEVAHESLIRSWERLRTWLDNSRDDLRLRRSLTRAAAEWANIGEEPSYLATGAQLTKFEAFASDSDLNLGTLEQSYLEASLAERVRKDTEEQARIAHEAKLEQRHRKSLRALVVVLLIATFSSLVLTVLAWNQRRIARQNEVAAQGLALTSGAQFATSQGNTELALALALEANRLDPTNVQAQLTLSELAYAPGIWRRMIEHTAKVSDVAYAADGEHVLSASSDNTLILWQISSGKPIRRFLGHNGPVTSVVFSPDGKTALSGSSDTSLIMWDVNSGEMIRRYEGHTDKITSVAISPDANLILSASTDKSLILWEADSGKVVRVLRGHTAEVHSTAFSPDGRTIASGSSDNYLILWDGASGQILHRLKGHLGAVTAVAFSPDGKSVLSGSLDQVLIQWDVASGSPIRRYEGHQDQVNDVSFSPDGKTIISAGGSEEMFNTTLEPILIVWDAASGKIQQRLVGHTAPATAAAFSPDGKGAISGSSDMSLIYWGLSGGAETRRFEGHTSAVNAVSLSADGKIALSASADTSLILWELSTGKLLQHISTNATLQAAALSPDGMSALSGNPDGRLRLWDMATGEAVRDFIGHDGPVTSVRFNKDGRTALSGSVDRTMILWDVASGLVLRIYRGHTNVVNSVAIGSDGRQALSGSYDGTLILWDLDSGQIIRRLATRNSVVNTVAFSPDNKTALAGFAEGGLILFDIEQGIEINHLTGHSAPVYSVMFSPDGTSAVSGSMDGSSILWDVASGQPIRRFLGHTDGIRAVAFSPDGHSVISGSLDGSIRLWRIDSHEDLISWTEANRFVIELPCEQRAIYHLKPLCEEEISKSSPDYEEELQVNYLEKNTR